MPAIRAWIVGVALSGVPAVAIPQPAPSVPAAPAVAPSQPQDPPVLRRLVPTAISRTIAFVAPIHPDCTSQGSVKYRIIEGPKHGTLQFTVDEDFPRLSPGSPTYSCVSKKVRGQKIIYKTDGNFSGDDQFALLMMFPDGFGSNWNYDVKVR